MASSPHSFLKKTPEWVEIPAEHLPQADSWVTEDDTPADNFFSAKQQRLLIESLYTSWTGPEDGRPFLADANVGVFSAVSEPPLVPDVFLTLDVQVPDDVCARLVGYTLAGNMAGLRKWSSRSSPSGKAHRAHRNSPIMPG